MDILKKERVKKTLDQFYKEYDLRSRIGSDPIEFPHQYKDPLDIEIAGIIASSLAFGNVKQFKPVIRKILDLAEGDLPGFVMEFSRSPDIGLIRGFYHRIWNYKDIAYLIYMTGHIVREYGSIGTLFVSFYKEEDPDIKDCLIRFTDYLHSLDTSRIYGEKTYPAGMFPSPRDRSACKRLNLYLRWMVRSGDGIDFGLWNQMPPSKLIIPLDTHIARICRNLGLARTKTPGWGMAEEITKNLRLFDPEDPVKYDFALCHMGISGECGGIDDERCNDCSLDDVCTKGA
ncbi:MAG: TIGR02757 family protein [Nitrospirota bacterium]